MAIFGKVFEGHARAVWLARHWSVDRMLDVWARCIAAELATCGERIPSELTVTDAVHLWAHDTGSGPCRARWVDHRRSAALELLWLELPELRAVVLEELQAGRDPHGLRTIP